MLRLKVKQILTVSQDLRLLVGEDGSTRGTAEAGHAKHLRGEVAAMVTLKSFRRARNFFLYFSIFR